VGRAYGDWGSRKYLLASLDQSLARMGLDYVDVFYSHRPDPETPIEETMGALAAAVKSGRALYVGVSNYDAAQTRAAAAALAGYGVPLLIHQPRYNMFNRWVERDLLAALTEIGAGCIAFSPLDQGLLTNRYLHGIPADSRAGRDLGFLRPDRITPALLTKIRALDEIARQHGATLAQFATRWIMRRPEITTVLIGASRAQQLDDIHAGLALAPLAADELARIETILAG